MEKTNIRYVTPDQIGEAVCFASVDVSFISLTKVLEPVRALLANRAQMVVLIKPQFEAGREKVGKKGVVRDPKVHEEVIEAVIHCALQLGFTVLALEYSPIKGPEGNIEYLLYLEYRAEEIQTEEFSCEGNADGQEDWQEEISRVVWEAHKALDEKS